MNPTAEQIAALYDFQGALEPALKTLFIAREIKAFTSQQVASTGDPVQDQALIDEGWDIIDYYRDRPRVEILFTPGAGQGVGLAKTIAGIGEISVETSWNGQFKLDVFTIADQRIHKAFVTAIRFIMHTQLLTVNGAELPNHRIQTFQKDSGTTPTMKPENGVYQTSMLFDIDFSIQDQAWEQLNQQDL